LRPVLAKSFQDPHLNSWLGVVVYTYHPSNAGSINKRIGSGQDPTSKITNTERAGRVAQVVKHLPTKLKTVQIPEWPKIKQTNKKKTCHQMFCGREIIFFPLA
jgi:hypothetical protein